MGNAAAGSGGLSKPLSPEEREARTKAQQERKAHRKEKLAKHKAKAKDLIGKAKLKIARKLA